MFDSPVRPVLSYACEVWTGCTGAKGFQQVEQVHIMFLRGTLGVKKQQALLLCRGSLEGIHRSISGFFVVFLGFTYSFIFIYLSNFYHSFFLFLFFSICRSIYFLSFDPFLGFARCREGITRNKYKTNSKEQIRK
jgi:hypothetical protein